QLELFGVVGGGDRVGRGLLQGVAHAVHPLTRVAMRGHAQTPARKATAAGCAATVRTATASDGQRTRSARSAPKTRRIMRSLRSRGRASGARLPVPGQIGRASCREGWE